MKIQLSEREAAILLGATLMHWGVPFRTTARRELTELQQAVVDEASKTLIGLLETYQQTQVQKAQKVRLSDHERTLLFRVVEDCLNECGDDPSELRLQLNTSERQEVETLLDRLRPAFGGQNAGLA